MNQLNWEMHLNKIMLIIKVGWNLLLTLLVLTLVSCSSISSATGESPTVIPITSVPSRDATSTLFLNSPEDPIQAINTLDSADMTPPPSETQFVELAKQDLASRLNIDTQEITLLKITDIDWEDITQGCAPVPDQTLTKGRLSGYRIWLEVNDRDYVYHIGLDGKIFLCPD